MVELMSGLPDAVVGITASGQVTAGDYENVIIPAIESKFKSHDKIRVLYHIGPAFTGFTAGAVWDDTKTALKHFTAWKKVAVATDVDWIRNAMGIFSFAIPCPVRVFSNDELAKAKDWIAS